MTTTETPAHLRPSACYVCGREEHADATPRGHRFWSNADASAYFAAEDARLSPRGYNTEAAYVAQHRPY